MTAVCRTDLETASWEMESVDLSNVNTDHPGFSQINEQGHVHDLSLYTASSSDQ